MLKYALLSRIVLSLVLAVHNLSNSFLSSQPTGTLVRLWFRYLFLGTKRLEANFTPYLTNDVFFLSFHDDFIRFLPFVRVPEHSVWFLFTFYTNKKYKIIIITIKNKHRNRKKPQSHRQMYSCTIFGFTKNYPFVWQIVTLYDDTSWNNITYHRIPSPRSIHCRFLPWRHFFSVTNGSRVVL